MIESIDVRLREIGITDKDVQNRLDGKDKALVVTDQDVVYIDSSGVQRSTLRFVTKVITDKTGALTIRSSSGPAIEGSIRGFDVTELKVFFEGVKASIARSKIASSAAQSASQNTNEADAPAPLSSEPHVEHSAPVHSVPVHSVPDHSVPDHAVSDHSAFNLDAPLDHAAQEHHDAQPDHLAAFPGLMSIPAPAMDPWESLSTPRPTLEMPAVPGGLSGFSDDFDTNRAAFGNPSPDSLDWDEPALDPSSSKAARLNTPDHLELLEPDHQAMPDMPVMPAIPAQNASSAVLAATSAPDQSLSRNQSDALDSLTPTLAEQYAISPVSRWLKILAIPLGLLGIAAGALSVPATETTSIVPWLQVGGFIIGGASAALISYGIGDLLAIWSSMASDIRAVRRNQNH